MRVAEVPPRASARYLSHTPPSSDDAATCRPCSIATRRPDVSRALRSDLWLIPLLCVVASVVLAVGTLAIDRYFEYALVPQSLVGSPAAAPDCPQHDRLLDGDPGEPDAESHARRRPPRQGPVLPRIVRALLSNRRRSPGRARARSPPSSPLRQASPPQRVLTVRWNGPPPRRPSASSSSPGPRARPTAVRSLT